MIDDKKIEKAIEDYVRHSSVEDEYPGTEGEAFRAGANWAINEFLKNLWHPASEEPEGYDEWILLHYSVGNYYSLSQVLDFKSWKGFVERAPIKEWLYIDDLLPKEGGEHD